jgi:hypothetical protein
LRYAVSFVAAASLLMDLAAGECLSNPEFNDFFEDLAGGPIPQEGSCCQFDVCGIPCPQSTPAPGIGTGKFKRSCNGIFQSYIFHSPLNRDTTFRI